MVRWRQSAFLGRFRDFDAAAHDVRSGSESTHSIAHDKQALSRWTGARRSDFAIKNAYALQGDAQVLLVSTDEAGLGFSDQ